MELVENDILYLNIYDAIKRDDLVSFSALTTQDKTLSISLGRFPILSLCYMYGSKSIISQYQDRLIKIGNYVRVAEPFEAYDNFRKYAKKTLRLYISDDSIVTPIEMLAILGNIDYLSKVYYISHKSSAVIDNMSKIFSTLHKEKVDIDTLTFSVKNRKLKPKQFKAICVYSILSIFMSICMCMILVLQPILIGMGTSENPYMVYSKKQLIFALGSDKEYALGADIYIDSWDTIESYKGTLDGKGHTITIGEVKGEFIRILYGTIKNIDFVIKDTDIVVDGNESMVVLSNAAGAEIKNVDVSIDATLSNSTKLGSSTDTYIVSTLCYENLGTISNCDMDIKYEYESSGGTNMNLAGLVGVNYASIDNCTTTSDSSITATDVDVAGLVAYNYTIYDALGITQTGSINGVVNNATLVVNSTTPNWSPVVGGICIENRGFVRHSANMGSITVLENNNSTEDIVISVAGVVSQNYYEVSDCKNIGNISVEGYSAYIRVAGVVSTGNRISYPTFFSYYTNSVVSNSYNVGSISVVNHSDTKYTAVGGVIGVAISSALKDNYAIYTVNNDSMESYIGAICGLVSDSVINNNPNWLSGNVYYMDTYLGIGAIYQYYATDFTILLQGIDGDFVVGLDSIDMVKNSGVYWE